MPLNGQLALRAFWERRAQKLLHQVKEERIVGLETENSILHLKLAEKLKQDVKEFRNSSLVLLSSCREECQDRLSDLAARVRASQPSRDALRACQSEAARLQQSLQELDTRYRLEQQRRKALHNSLVELKGNIRVVCRIRPWLPEDGELDSPESRSSVTSPEVVSGEVTHAVDDETVLVKCAWPGYPQINKTYSFERAYGPADSQATVFGDVCPLLASLFDGYNMCIMAYGQTGSGKSHAMLGPHPEDKLGPQSGAAGDLGIIPRAAEELFRLISENPSRSPKVKLSIMEIYNNDIFDLLAKDSSIAVSGVKCDVVTTQAGQAEVPLLTHKAITSARQFMEFIHKALQFRVRHPTLIHKDSSRSHLVVTLSLTTVPSSNRTRSQSSCLKKQARGHSRRNIPRWSIPCRTSPLRRILEKNPTERVGQVMAKLQLVDLAGSECIGASGVTGLAVRETSFINQSLAALSDVLGALSERRDHIPYRNSKLTHLLQDSIGGDAKLLVILCVSPGRKHMAETLRGLGFGAQARQIERKQTKKGPPSFQTKKLGTRPAR